MAQARELLGEGLDERGKGDAVGALEKLKAAHALAHTPITGFELGQTYLTLGKLVEAREVFLSAAHMPARSGETSRSTSARSQSETLAEQLRSRIPTVRIKVTGVSPDSVALTIDGAVIPMEALEAPRFVNPGSHVIVARSTTGGASETRVDLKEGESRAVELRIVLTGGTPGEGSPPIVSAPASATHPVESPPEAPHPRSYVLVGSLLGAGAAVGIAGGVTMGVAAVQSKNANDNGDRSASDAAKTLWTGGLVAVVVGSVTFASGGVIFLVQPKGTDRNAAARPAVWLSTNVGSVALEGAW